MGVLYGSNTIHISSSTLIRGIQDVVPDQNLSRMVSLELVWDPLEVPIMLGFTGNQIKYRGKKPCRTEPVFSSLKFLRISFKRLTYGDMDPITGLTWPYKDEQSLTNELRNRFLPQIDGLLDRIVPPSTDVMISLREWSWYEHLDLWLMGIQGKEKTKPQRADIEGLKCWREIPKQANTGERDIGVQTTPTTEKRLREGYWIHIPIAVTHLDRGSKCT